MDVATERQRVLRGDADNDMLKIENLTKVCVCVWQWGVSIRGRLGWSRGLNGSEGWGQERVGGGVSCR